MLVIMIVTGTLVSNVKIFGHYIKAKEETNGLVDESGKKSSFSVDIFTILMKITSKFLI